MEQLFLTILNRAVTAGWLVLLVMVLRVVLKKAPRAAHYGLWAIVAVRLLWPGTSGRRQPGATTEPISGDVLTAAGTAVSGGLPAVGSPAGAAAAETAARTGQSGPHRRGGVACGHGGHGAVSGRQLCAAAGAAADGGAAGGRRVGERTGPVSLCAGVYPAPHLPALRPGPGKPGLCAGP